MDDSKLCICLPDMCECWMNEGEVCFFIVSFQYPVFKSKVYAIVLYAYFVDYPIK